MTRVLRIFTVAVILALAVAGCGSKGSSSSGGSSSGGLPSSARSGLAGTSRCSWSLLRAPA